MNDSELKYINKLYKDGSDVDEIIELSEFKFNRKFKRSEIDSILDCIDQDLTTTEEISLVESLKSVYKLKLEKNKLNKKFNSLLDKQVSQEHFSNTLKKALARTKFFVHPKIKQVTKKAIDRVIVMHLSDMHFQSQIDKEEMGGLNCYTNIEEARRLAFLTEDVSNYKIHHRASTELIIAINGDILQGVIHNFESYPAITTQVAASIHLLAQSISYLAGSFKSVRVICTTGNHERMTHKSNKGRQNKEKWDSYSSIVYISLRHALQSYKNVKFEIPVTPYAYVDILGHKFLFTHSDTLLNIGYPGKTINVESAKNKINTLKEGIGHIDVVCVGHVHVDTKQILPNGVTLLTNGSMSGIDEFALSIGITANNPTQQIFEVTKDYAVGDLRSVHLKSADSQSYLDKIIVPFKGKF